MPLGVRKEVAALLKLTQAMGVIEPSNNPCDSPTVIVRRKDGSLLFCIDYHELDSVTKPDTFPLPRIHLLDQLGKSEYFATLDIASGHWQIRMQQDSKEKTALATHQGLYQF